MKTKSLRYFLVILFFSVSILQIQAQNFDMEKSDEPATTSSAVDDTTSSSFSAGLMVGATTIGGENFQQISFMGDVPIGKLGFGLDIQLNIGPDGRIRKEDWDEFTDYLDKIYYIRWARKGAPFYFKIGGLDYSYLGYSNVINGYTNMIEYPTIKRWGMEMSFETDKFGGELLINDFKELFAEKPSMLLGMRGYYNIVGKLALGASFASDFNEFNALKDTDGDGYPDEIDRYPTDDDWVTEYDYTLAQSVSKTYPTGDTEYVEKSVEYGLIDSTRTEDLPKYGDSTSVATVWSVDLGYPIIDGEIVKLDIYSHFTKIIDHGWGVTAPGLRLKAGRFVTLRAEYRHQTDEFMFGYFNRTYEIERANFVTGPDNVKRVVTKKDELKTIEKQMNGFLAGLTIHFGRLADLEMNYQDLVDENSFHLRTLHGEFGLREGAIQSIPIAKAYYVQDNVENFRRWKTPSTVLGFQLGYNMSGVTVGFDYRFTFQDMDGNGIIEGSDETIKTIGVKTSMSF